MSNSNRPTDDNSSKPIIQQYLEFYAKQEGRRGRPFMDDLKSYKGTEAEAMNNLLDSIKEQIVPLSERPNFKDFPPFPDDKEKREEMMKELADIFKKILEISDIEKALENNPSLVNREEGGEIKTGSVDMSQEKTIGGLFFAMLEHISPKPPAPVVDYNAPTERMINEQNVALDRDLAKDAFFMRFYSSKCYNKDNPAQAYHETVVNDFKDAQNLSKNIKDQRYVPVLGINYLNQIKQEAMIAVVQSQQPQTQQQQPQTQQQQPQTQQQQPQTQPPPPPTESAKRKKLSSKFASFKASMPSFSSMFPKTKTSVNVQTQQTAEQQEKEILRNVEKLANALNRSGHGELGAGEIQHDLLKLLRDKSNGINNTKTLIQAYQGQDKNNIHKLSDAFWLNVAKLSPVHATLVLNAIHDDKNPPLPIHAEDTKDKIFDEASKPSKKPSITSRVKEAMKEVKDNVENTIRPGRR